MASTTLSVVTPVITGAAVTAKGSIASSETVTIQPTTAQSALDFDSLAVRVTNESSTASIVLTIADGAEYSDGTVGDASVTVPTASTVVIGGQLFESARFQNSSGTVVITQAGAGPGSYEAYQAPNALE